MSPTWGRLTFAVMIFFRPKPLHVSKRISKCLLPSDVACSVLCARTLESVSASSDENVLVQMCMNRCVRRLVSPARPLAFYGSIYASEHLGHARVLTSRAQT